MKGIPNFILFGIAEIGMHVIVLQPCDFHQETKWITVDHLIPLEQCLRVREGDYLIIFAVCDDQEGIYFGDVVHEVETVVLEGRVS